jgi:protein-disulfide isomerase
MAGGSGPKCTGDDACVKTSTCDGLKCRPGLFSNIGCANDDTCKKVGTVDNPKTCYDGVCKQVGLGGLPCLETADCLRYKSCNAENKCVGRENHIDPTYPMRPCDIDDDCTPPQTGRCDGFRCVKGGNSTTSCIPPKRGVEEPTNGACVHAECVLISGDNGRMRDYCGLVTGAGFSQCSFPADCPAGRTPGTQTVPTSGWEIPKKPTEEVLALLKPGTKSRASFGSTSAPVTVVMFQDLTCGMCKHAFNTIFKGVEKKYIPTGKVRFIFAEYPLYGANSFDGQLGNAALCANEKGMYRKFIEAAYQTPHDGSSKIIENFSKSLKEKSAWFEKCVKENRHLAQVAKDFELGKQLGVEGTPTFFINGKPFSNTPEFAPFEAGLESELAKSGPRAQSKKAIKSVSRD